ncbi:MULTISPECIES: rhodanese-related sulfurtransferase [unclassified Roseitalea]|uniref:oxygen-dependent tRNA uridine(34) hydroxylase TrhO n=1 Tax=unclassified Roseitalea TaxID=2639107 RepID=UPI00273D885C|nr:MULTISPECIES: rhodanese-related sulfurtransferase [unclassified Roseitalea]
MTEDRDPIVVAALYHFARLDRFESLRKPLAELCCKAGLKGTLLLASEGINGTVAGPRAGIDAMLAFLRAQPEFAGLEHKESYAPNMPFYRLKVRLKSEIVTMGVPDTDPTQIVGTYVAPDEWNALIADPDTIVIDTRNDYEVKVGTFEGAVNPETASFREFPDWVRRNENRLRGRKIAMFCTGGIRCEKATAFVRSLGHDDVFHLKGGILKYLETVPEAESTWRGECFVFDERVSVGHGLAPGHHRLCRACRHPLSPQDMRSAHFRNGVQCPHCVGKFSDDDRARFAERQRQVDLARARGARHIGAEPAAED